MRDKEVINSIKKTEQFVNCDELNTIAYSHLENDEGKIVLTKIVKLTDDVKFYGRCYIYNIKVNKKLYDENEKMKNGATVKYFSTGEHYNGVKLIVDINYDNQYKFNDNERERVKNLVDNCLKNPGEYVEKEYEIVGIFERYIQDGVEYKCDVDNIILNLYNYFGIYKQTVNKEAKEVLLERLFLPIEYEEDFYNTYKGIIFSETECSEFIEKHKIEDYKIFHYKTMNI